MVKNNIAVLNSKDLKKEGFTKKISNDITLKQCLTLAKEDGATYVAIEPDNSASAVEIDTRGKCYSSTTHDPFNSTDSPDGTYDVYIVSDCKDNDCLKNSQKAALITEIKSIKKEIAKKKQLMQDVNVKLYSVENNVSLSKASDKFRLKQEQVRLANAQQSLNVRMEGLSGQLQALSTASQNANVQLADKNRLLANANTKIQQSFNKLGSVNSKINTATQDIYQNNIDYERKEQIIKTLKSIIVILFIMMLIMIAYYGVAYAQQNYPDSFESFNNSLNSMGFGNNPFS